jgi:hypothetical protein
MLGWEVYSIANICTLVNYSPFGAKCRREQADLGRLDDLGRFPEMFFVFNIFLDRNSTGYMRDQLREHYFE